MISWKLNTSNPGKLEEFKRLFAKHGSLLEASHVDLKEIDADPIMTVAHKASQLEENILVEDTSLDVEGASIGIHIRWLLDHLSEFIGHKAVWTVYLAFRQGDKVFIFKGSITGTIVAPSGSAGFGFDPVFLPDGATETLAASKPDPFNARALAVDALMEGKVFAEQPAIKEWKGPWQNEP